MNAQTGKKSGLMNNTAVQMVALAILAIVLVALAAKYIW
jgi:hypothetical protein